MKRLVLVSLATTGMLFAAPAWSHHMAEGVISDDLWVVIDTRLQDTGHAALDFDAIFEDMGVTMDLGYPALTSFVVLDTQAAGDIEVYIEGMLTTLNTFPSGETSSGNADRFDIHYIPNGDGTTTIIIYEPIGSGESQQTAPPVESPPQNGRQ